MALEVLEVERSRRELDRIAGGPGDDRLPLAEGAAQLGDVDLERLGGGRRRALAPQLVDQPVGRDDLVAVVQEQDREQRAALGARHRDLLAARPHAQRPEDAELHRLTGALPAACRPSARCRP
jgi:hypothetical protein